jgi:hypothetical protein
VWHILPKVAVEVVQELDQIIPLLMMVLMVDLVVEVLEETQVLLLKEDQEIHLLNLLILEMMVV